jgi:DNA invertase Pin-like site-specific DNA recombinase
MEPGPLDVAKRAFEAKATVKRGAARHLLGELHAKKVGLYLHQQGLDTSTPAGRAMFQMLGLFAEFESSMIRERVLSGMARARISGTKSGRAIGRPPVRDDTREAIQTLLQAGQSERAIVAQLGVSKGSVGRVRAAMAVSAVEGR